MMAATCLLSCRPWLPLCKHYSSSLRLCDHAVLMEGEPVAMMSLKLVDLEEELHVHA